MAGSAGAAARLAGPQVSLQAPILPWKISVNGGSCAIGVGDAPSGAPLTVIFVRREALLVRVEVRDHPPLSLSQQGGEAEGSLTWEAPGRVGAALTKPGRASTARWCGSGECGEKE